MRYSVAIGAFSFALASAVSNVAFAGGTTCIDGCAPASHASEEHAVVLSRSVSPSSLPHDSGQLPAASGQNQGRNESVPMTNDDPSVSDTQDADVPDSLPSMIDPGVPSSGEMSDVPDSAVVSDPAPLSYDKPMLPSEAPYTFTNDAGEPTQDQWSGEPSSSGDDSDE